MRKHKSGPPDRTQYALHEEIAWLKLQVHRLQLKGDTVTKEHELLSLYRHQLPDPDEQ